MFRKTKGEPPKPDHAFAFCRASFLMTFAMGGIPHTGSRQPPIPPSIRVFSNESTLRMRWPKYWSFGFSISPSHEYSGFISFRVDWLDLLAVQGTLSSTIAGKHQFFGSHPYGPNSHPYMTTGKTVSSVQFSRSVVSDSSRPHESQHARPPCPSPSPGVHSDPRPSSQ